MKTAILEVRLQAGEKQGFQEAADIAGLTLSQWVRERLRKAARVELEDAGRQVPFIRPFKLTDNGQGSR